MRMTFAVVKTEARRDDGSHRIVKLFKSATSAIDYARLENDKGKGWWCCVIAAWPPVAYGDGTHMRSEQFDGAYLIAYPLLESPGNEQDYDEDIEAYYRSMRYVGLKVNSIMLRMTENAES